jgi:hypothetical protein
MTSFDGINEINIVIVSPSITVDNTVRGILKSRISAVHFATTPLQEGSESTRKRNINPTPFTQ